MVAACVPAKVVRLKVKHIDSAQKIIRIEQSKGRKDRNVMLSPETLDLLRQWWKMRPSRYDAGAPVAERWLFPGNRHGACVHRILEGAGFGAVSLTPLDPVIQLAGPKGEAEAADFVMAMGPLVRVLPSLSAAQRENVRAALEVYFKGHATSQGVVLPAANWVVRGRV